MIYFCPAAFRWVNTLGMAASHGIDAVLRHSFFDYGYSHLVDQHFNPLPVSLLSADQGETLIHIFSASQIVPLHHHEMGFIWSRPAALQTLSVSEPAFQWHLPFFPVGVIR